MSTEPKPCEARIDTAAIRENARALVRAGASVPLLADVSADGYGHGAVQSARAALEGGAVWLGVSSVADAVALRAAGIRAPVLASFSVAGGGLEAAHELGVVLRGSFDNPGSLYEPGPALYGLGSEHARLGLLPAMRVSATVMGIKTIERGEGVSYGYTFRATERTNLAMIAMGYADGLDRRAGNVASVTLGGGLRRIVGRVAMNAAVLDLGRDTVQLGDEAVLFGIGDEPPADSWAELLGITDVEVVTVFGRMLARSYR
jgi:alanine racemase